jgi:hypothetical protein
MHTIESGSYMKLTQDLNDFNKQFAEVLLPFFPNGIEAYQDEYDLLLFRGKIPNSNDPDHVGSHVVVKLEKDVKEALEKASPAERNEMTKNLISNLGTQIRAQYDQNNIGQFALKVVGNMRIISGK